MLLLIDIMAVSGRAGFLALLLIGGFARQIWWLPNYLTGNAVEGHRNPTLSH